MSLFNSEADQMQALSEEMRSTIESGDACNYASLYPEQGESLYDLLSDLAEAAMKAPGGHGDLIERAYAWGSALTGNLG
jgi:hypothetical protein